MSNKIYTCLFLSLLFACGVTKANKKNLNHKEAADSPVVTIFKIQEDTLKARPERGFEISQHWQGDSISGSYKVWLQIISSEGEVVFEDPYFPPVPTYAWNGDVTYTHQVTLPVWEISNNRTVDVSLPEGQYDIVAGLYDENNSAMLELNTGDGVTQFSKGLYRIGVLVLDSLAPVPCPGEPSLDLEGYSTTFEDEFESLSVSAWGPAGEGGSTWIAHTPWYGDFGDADFVNPALGFPFTVDSGILRIEAAIKDGEWKSGLLSAVDPDGRGFKQQFGYFECRAKLPSGPGVWPAFWLMGTKNRWASGPRINPEVDIIEQYGHWPNRFSFALHLWGLGGLSSIHESERIEVFGMQDDFHTYGILIEKDSMILYFDGVEMYRRKTPDALHTPLYPLVNLALGPGWPLDKTTDPSYMYIDYIRIYDRYFRSDVLDINWDKKLIKVPSGIHRDSLLHYMDIPEEIDINLQLSPCRRDSFCHEVLTGDSLLLKESGDKPQMAFRIEVKDTPPSGLEVTFIVSDDSDRLVEGAEIIINSDTLTTNENGIANLILSAGEYSYSVTSGSYTLSGIVELQDNPVAETVNLQRIAYPLKILVTQGSNPVANAMVSVDGKYFLTDSSGEVVVDLPAGSYEYVVSLSGHEDLTGAVVIEDSGENLLINFQQLTLKYNSLDEVQIFPNPSNGEFVIDRKFSTSEMEVRVTDISGRQILKEHCGRKKRNTIILPYPEPGIYILKISIDNKTENRKILVQ